jgi:hypothetical protein
MVRMERKAPPALPEAQVLPEQQVLLAHRVSKVFPV